MYIVNANEARENPTFFFRRAVKIVNGNNIAAFIGGCPGTNNGASLICGLTVAAENPVYIQGDFNSNSQAGGWNDPHVATSVVADAVTPLSVSHQGVFPAVTLSFNLAPGVALGQAVEKVQQMAERLRAPPTLNGSFQGTAQAFQASLSSMPLLVAAAILVIYIVLGVLYESYIHPITILSTLPSAGIGALLALQVAGLEFSIIAMIGVLLLVGIVKKNAIMMIDVALDRERNQGLEPQEAIYQACLLRFRPILMTTMAAMLGALPLALGFGDGAELRQPLGISIIGGLLVSQVLTLYTTPVIYLYLDRFRRRDRDIHSRLARRMGGLEARA